MNFKSLRRITSAEFVRRFGMWQDLASTEPIFVTHHSRDRLVIMSAEAFSRINQISIEAEWDPVRINNFKLGSAVDRLSQGFAILDRDLVLTEINPTAGSYLKLTRAAAVGISIKEHFAGFERTLLHRHIMQAIQSGEAATFTQPSFTFEGRWLHFETVPYENGVAMFFRDITTEIQNRRAAEIERATDVAISADGQIGRAVISLRGTIERVNPWLADQVKSKPEALSRSRFVEMLPQERRAEATQQIEAIFAGSAPSTFRSALLVNQNEEIAVRLAVSELRGADGPDGAVIVINRV